MSLVKVAGLSNLTGTKSLTTDQIIDRASCQAWVNFNGTGTVAIRASFNVSSITDNGPGNYIVNFTNNMPDVNYCAIANNSSSNQSYVAQAYNSTWTVSAFNISVVIPNVGWYDSTMVNVAVFR